MQDETDVSIILALPWNTVLWVGMHSHWVVVRYAYSVKFNCNLLILNHFSILEDKKLFWMSVGFF